MGETLEIATWEEVVAWEELEAWEEVGVKRVLNFVLSDIKTSRLKGYKPVFRNPALAYSGFKLSHNFFTNFGNTGLSIAW
jgi:hypothetical protein